MSHTEVVGPVKAFFATTDPVFHRRALCFHFLVISAEVVTIETPGQVVVQLGEVLVLARQALGLRGGGAVRSHVSARWTLLTGEDFSAVRVLVLKRGNDFGQGSPDQEQER